MNLSDAVYTTQKIVDFSNSSQGFDFFVMLGEKFGLVVNSNYHVYVNSITDVCPDCSNCHFGSCEVGCLIEPDFKICYTGIGLSLLGNRLIVHEMAHLWFSQVYETSQMSRSSYMDQSERFAQFVEKNYTNDIISEVQNITPIISKKTTSIVIPVAIGIGILSATAITAYVIFRKH